MNEKMRNNEVLEARRLAMILTFRCTLKCKLCCNCIPMYDNPPLIDIADLKADMKRVFELFDRVEWLQFVGGEPFIHPQFAELLRETRKYENRFDKIVIMTNATIPLKEEIIEEMRYYGSRCIISLSDYGELSRQSEQYLEIFEKNGIICKYKKYYGDMQYYGGWIDEGGFIHRHYDEAELENVYQNCSQHNLKNMHMYKGKIYACTRSLNADDLGIVPAGENEYVDVYDTMTSDEDKRRVLSGLCNTRLNCCNYCVGKNAENLDRHPAAEQMR